jgi:hypothetical protein
MKNTPKTFTMLVGSEAMESIRDRSKSVDTLAETLLKHWSFDLYSRKPGPAYYNEDGTLETTDLDLVCFLSALADRNAVINLPSYKSLRAKSKREGETVISKANRHGKVLGLSANKSVFTFSIRVEDQNVMQSDGEGNDSTGAPRNFLITGLDGSFYEGWSVIEFVPSAKENDFLNDKKLWTDNKVYFKNFVHPLRWTSFFGSYYFVTKALIDRLEQEVEYYNAQIKRIQALGVRFPTTGDGSKKEWSATKKGETEPVTVTAFEAEVDIPWVREFPDTMASQEILVNLDKKVHNIKFKQLPALRFATRATELAFFQKTGRLTSFPAWMKDAKWETNYVQPGKRTEWNRLIMTQRFPFEKGYAIRYREFQKTERIGA